MTSAIVDIQPLTTFQHNVEQFLDHVKVTHRSITITVDGRPQFVLQEASEYRRLLDLAAFADAGEAIRQGLLDAGQGLSRPAEDVFEEMREKYGIPR